MAKPRVIARLSGGPFSDCDHGNGGRIVGAQGGFDLDRPYKPEQASCRAKTIGVEVCSPPTGGVSVKVYSLEPPRAWAFTKKGWAIPSERTRARDVLADALEWAMPGCRVDRPWQAQLKESKKRFTVKWALVAKWVIVAVSIGFVLGALLYALH